MIGIGEKNSGIYIGGVFKVLQKKYGKDIYTENAIDVGGVRKV